MKQTAVEWLFEQCCSEKISWNKDQNGKLFIDTKTSNIFQQAKAMQKEQIKDAWFDGVTNWDSEKEVEDYINETFKSE